MVVATREREREHFGLPHSNERLTTCFKDAPPPLLLHGSCLVALSRRRRILRAPLRSLQRRPRYPPPLPHTEFRRRIHRVSRAPRENRVLGILVFFKPSPPRTPQHDSRNTTHDRSFSARNPSPASRANSRYDISDITVRCSLQRFVSETTGRPVTTGFVILRFSALGHQSCARARWSLAGVGAFVTAVRYRGNQQDRRFFCSPLVRLPPHFSAGNGPLSRRILRYVRRSGLQYPLFFERRKRICKNGHRSL